MGVINGVGRLLCRLKPHLDYKGCVGTLGKQNIIITQDEWAQMAQSENVTLCDVPMSVERHMRYNNEFITSKYLFGSLGCDEVLSVDVSAYEKPDFVCDLNEPEITNSLHEKFDLVFNGSTIEHIFHLPNVLRNIFFMLKVGGTVIHIAPTNQFIDDGFYQISPTLFVDYYSVNKYNIDYVALYFAKIERYERDGRANLRTIDRFEAYDFDTVAETLSRHQSFGDELCQTIFIATKTKETRCDLLPHQRRYASKGYWQDELPNEAYLSRHV